MLILTRATGESILIAGNIEITITQIKVGQVQIGINAPKNIPVHRSEVAKRIEDERRRAATS